MHRARGISRNSRTLSGWCVLPKRVNTSLPIISWMEKGVVLPVACLTTASIFAIESVVSNPQTVVTGASAIRNDTSLANFHTSQILTLSQSVTSATNITRYSVGSRSEYINRSCPINGFGRELDDSRAGCDASNVFRVRTENRRNSSNDSCVIASTSFQIFFFHSLWVVGSMALAAKKMNHSPQWATGRLRSVRAR